VALPSHRRAENAPGDLFVDDGCIACDVCRQLAPETFGGADDDLAFVARQPLDASARRRALHALVSCPVAAIGAGAKVGIREAARAFPLEFLPGVLRCGYADEATFGAMAWLLRRPDGNVLVDAPRFAGPLVERIRALGGVRWLFLTHRDDVGDHARWRAAFGCERLLHTRDVGPGTGDVERQLDGDAPIPLAADLLAVPVPGHTAGSMALLAGERYLFTGDHLWGDAAGRLTASPHVCWYDWGEQARSVEKLADLPFQWVLPGHGRPWQVTPPATIRGTMRSLAAAMQRARGRARPAAPDQPLV
jgi:glyoxylase-like metal-dependent hydrolase (beta-lactamase superfamily II)/ferredoxin